MSEADTLRAVLEAVGGMEDVRIWRANSGVAVGANGRHVRFGVVGQADISGIIRGGIRLEIEVKSPSGSSSPAQVRFGTMIRKMGGIYLVVRSVEEAKEGLASALSIRGIHRVT